MNSLAKSLVSLMDHHPDVRRLWVALSGGLDSCVLLHLLAGLRPRLPVQVLHINHQLSPHADKWQAHCEHLAASYGFPFVCETVEVIGAGRGLEMAAREARYAAFERHVEQGDMLLLAHHRDDQAETLLLRLLRGTGLRGMGVMAAVRALGSGLAARPLLEHPRARLRAYALSEGLQWVEDESNQEVDFDRNYLRHEVLPLLEKRWPDFTRRWAETARLARDNERLLREYAAGDLNAADRRQERLGQSVALGYLFGLTELRRNALLRHWVQTCGYSSPQQVHLEKMDQFFSAANDAQPLLAWGGCELRRFAGRLYLLPRLAETGAEDVLWDTARILTLSDNSQLSAVGSCVGLRADKDYRVCLRQGGERCRPHNRAHSQTLKKLLQEYQLEPWLRDRVPLIYAGDQLAAVGDLWVCRDFHTDQAPAWQVVWSYRHYQSL
jgi:tRNA(Ile)-lysidine synthase